MTLSELASALRRARGLALKRDILAVSAALPEWSRAPWCEGDAWVRNGDDAAAVPDGDGYILLAAEGMLPSFVASDPWFAGFCSVLVNVSDVLAMGGRPYAAVDVLFAGDPAHCAPLFAGMSAAAGRLGVPVVGGHTSRSSSGESTLAVAIVGRAQRLITSFAAQPGDELLVAYDLRGAFRGETTYFDAATAADGSTLQQSARVLPELAESGLVRAGKDVSMAGLVGTLLMLCEGSAVGARLQVDAVPRPADAPLLRWLLSFPSFGFVLAVAPEASSAVQRRFAEVGVSCASVGHFDDSRQVTLSSGPQRALFWDLAEEPLTGFGSAHRAARAP